MRHSVDGRQFSRNTSHRAAMFRNMANSVIQHEQIVTTVEKAKEIRRVVDRLVTLGKKKTPHARRLAFDRTRSKLVVGKLFNQLAERYASRNGGYTRILKISDRRRGDGAQMAMIEMVDHPPINRKRVKKEASEKDQKKAAENTAAADPFKGMRKLFNQKKAASAKKASKSARGTTRKVSSRGE